MQSVLALGHLLMDVQLYVSAPPGADEAALIWEPRCGGGSSASNFAVAARRMGAEALKELSSRADYLFLNEREFEALLGGDRNKAFDLGVSLVVVKRGAAGAAAYPHDGRRVGQPAFKAEAVDTTGSGDAFDAAFVVSALEVRDLEGCWRRANAAGALKAARKGARSAPTREEVERSASK